MDVIPIDINSSRSSNSPSPPPSSPPFQLTPNFSSSIPSHTPINSHINYQAHSDHHHGCPKANSVSRQRRRLPQEERHRHHGVHRLALRPIQARQQGTAVCATAVTGGLSIQFPSRITSSRKNTSYPRSVAMNFWRLQF